MKSCEKLKFNLDSTALAELVPGSMDANHNFIVKEGVNEFYLANNETSFEEMKNNVTFRMKYKY